MFKQDLEAQSKVKNLEFYTENCKMNNAIIRTTICEGRTVEGLTDQQIQKVNTEQCGGSTDKKQLSPATIRDICVYREAGLDMATTKGFVMAAVPNITDEEINNVKC